MDPFVSLIILGWKGSPGTRARVSWAIGELRKKMNRCEYQLWFSLGKACSHLSTHPTLIGALVKLKLTKRRSDTIIQKRKPFI
jgi:hypothetical protein